MDTLTKWFSDLDNIDNMTSMELFQAGVTKSAVSMRQRAIDAVNSVKMPNDVKNQLLNKIGVLPDIPPTV